MGPKTQKLSQLLDQLEQLFLDLGLKTYAQVMRRSHSEVQNGDFHGVRRILWAFQGYGRMDGVLGDNIGNDKLDSLLNEAHTLAESIEGEQ